MLQAILYASEIESPIKRGSVSPAGVADYLDRLDVIVRVGDRLLRLACLPRFAFRRDIVALWFSRLGSLGHCVTLVGLQRFHDRLLSIWDQRRRV